MTVDKLIELAHGRGYRLTVRGNQLVVNGNGYRDAGLLAELRARKTELVLRMGDAQRPTSEISEKSEKSPRHGGVPNTEIPLAPTPPLLSERESRLLIDTVLGQEGATSPRVPDWLMARALRYSEANPHWTPLQQDLAAACDLLKWQTGGR